jgi:hypothetical protein
VYVLQDKNHPPIPPVTDNWDKIPDELRLVVIKELRIISRSK